MEILIIHQGFPGQFTHVIPNLQSRGDKISVISAKRKKTISNGINYHTYEINRGNGTGVHPLALETESKVLRAAAVAEVADKLRKSNYQPDLILAHPGWGEAMFLADIWPETPQLHYIEFFYRSPGTDTDFPDRYSLTQTWQEMARGRMKNAAVLLNLQAMSWGITPTGFQQSTLPLWARNCTSVIHDGIDTNWASPNKNSSINLSNGICLTSKDEIISFVNRSFEPYRGIHIFIESLKTVLRERPNAQVLMVGEDTPKVSYGAHRQDGKGWLSHLKDEIGDQIDWSRVHAIGKIEHSLLREIYRITRVHVYLTYPFVLSWSMLEAMSCGALIIASETSPVQEVISNEQNGILVNFHSPDKLAEKIIDALAKPEKYLHIRKNARITIKDKYELKGCIVKQLSLIDAVANKAIGK